MISGSERTLLEKQHYKVVGGHSAVKVCLWLGKSLRGEGACYKQQFYGIESHRCLQMTPALPWCTQECAYCWRNTNFKLPNGKEEFDEPSEIIDGCEEGHRKLISGFGGIKEGLDLKKFKEAQQPNQAAISLAGEPTLYPKLSDLIGEFHKRSYTTFLVSNGTLPERIKALNNLPTNLYVSLTAPSKELHQRVDSPLIPDAWKKINESLELFPSLDTRTVVRLTLVKGMNMQDHGDYAKIISKAEPNFVECKAFMLVGGSRDRLTLEHMPSHAEVREFAGKLAGELSYELKDEREDSRVVLLSK